MLNLLIDCRFDVSFDVTERRLSFSSKVLNLALLLQLLVADDLAGDFLHFAFGFFDTAVGLVLVHGFLQIIDEILRERWRFCRMLSGKRLGGCSDEFCAPTNSSGGGTRLGCDSVSWKNRQETAMNDSPAELVANQTLGGRLNLGCAIRIHAIKGMLVLAGLLAVAGCAALPDTDALIARHQAQAARFESAAARLPKRRVPRSSPS